MPRPGRGPGSCPARNCRADPFLPVFVRSLAVPRWAIKASASGASSHSTHIPPRFKNDPMMPLQSEPGVPQRHGPKDVNPFLLHTATNEIKALYSVCDDREHPGRTSPHWYHRAKARARPGKMEKFFLLRSNASPIAPISITKTVMPFCGEKWGLAVGGWGRKLAVKVET